MTTRDEILAKMREADLSCGPNEAVWMCSIERFYHLAQAAAYERAASKLEELADEFAIEEIDGYQTIRMVAKEIRALKEVKS